MPFSTVRQCISPFTSANTTYLSLSYRTGLENTGLLTEPRHTTVSDAMCTLAHVPDRVPRRITSFLAVTKLADIAWSATRIVCFTSPVCKMNYKYIGVQ